MLQGAIAISGEFRRRVDEARRRLHTRYASDALRVEINRRRYRTLDWSLGGFRLDRCALALGADDQVRGRIAFKGMAPGEFVAEVTHIGESGEIGFRFLEVSPQILLSMGRGFVD